mmetsp:Transcript_6701/g.11748  ORF Transcript_6701/g.11748 Transcript_6701/m.11748 type:complete len:91 (-) Transcript_6701:56-328(-)
MQGYLSFSWPLRHAGFHAGTLGKRHLAEASSESAQLRCLQLTGWNIQSRESQRMALQWQRAACSRAAVRIAPMLAMSYPDAQGLYSGGTW